MSNCASCNQAIAHNICGCGTSQCKPWSSCISGPHCDPPPTPPPCGFRQVRCATAPGGFEVIPVWHSVHPLIPRAKADCVGLVDMLGYCGHKEEEAIDKALACELVNGELNTSSCTFPGDRYFSGVILYAAARIELIEADQLWRTSMRSAALKGWNFSGQQPRLEDQPSWQLRKNLEVRRFGMFSNTGRQQS